MRILFFLLIPLFSFGQSPKDTPIIHQEKADGYRGIWFTLGQFYPAGDKYSGGLGTYTAKHCPTAIYVPEVEKTFFVYGGTRLLQKKNICCAWCPILIIPRNQVPRPTIVHDKQGVDDPHDNASIARDDSGYIWVFVSGRARHRPGFKYKSLHPNSIDAFQQISEEEMAYPQPWYVPGEGFIHLFTKYTGLRELYFETSKEGTTWTSDQKIAGIREEGAERGGHYQVSNRQGDTIATFINRHPNGIVDQRTDLYYLQTVDMGKTWTNIQGEVLSIPLTEVENVARVEDYASKGKNVYLKDLQFDATGHPVCLYITSKGHEPGPENGPREWRLSRWNGEAWDTQVIFQSDHNYDMGSLYREGNTWKVIAPTEPGPQEHQTGGEVVMWISRDDGHTWETHSQLTQNSPANHSYCRRPVHAHPDFYSFWADGNPLEFSASYLYFTHAEGKHVWKLPEKMENEFEKPVRIR